VALVEEGALDQDYPVVTRFVEVLVRYGIEQVVDILLIRGRYDYGDPLFYSILCNSFPGRNAEDDPDWFKH
jgi:hypothetical protein